MKLRTIANRLRRIAKFIGQAASLSAVPGHRTVTQIALNLLEGAAVVTRAHQLRTYGVAVPDETFSYRPRLLS